MPIKILDKLTVDPQCQDEWCWAAVAVAIQQFYPPPTAVKQCQVVDLVLPGNDCCHNASSTNCTMPVLLEDVLAKIKHFRGLHPPPNNDLEVKLLKDEIDAGRPVCIRFQVSQKDGHFSIVKGYDDTDSNNLKILIIDPQFPECWCSYPEVLSGYEGGASWTDSYFTE